LLRVEDDRYADHAFASNLRDFRQAAVSSTVRIEQKPAAGKQDIGLPRLSGYNMARMIREQNGHNGRPVLVAVTGWGQDEDRRRSEGAGFDSHLVKPVDENALQELLANVSARMLESKG